MFQALRNEIIVKVIRENKSSNIIIPETAKKFKLYDGEVKGEVISIGKDSKFKNDLKQGDYINWQRHEGKLLKIIDQVEYYSIKDRWIMGKLLD